MMHFDLHIHSLNSCDSKTEVIDIINSAQKDNLSGIAITDHQALTYFDDNAYSSPLWIIRGSEIKTEIGDIIGLFIRKPLLSRKSFDLIEEIHSQDGIAILAHPFKRFDNYPESVIKRIDAVEIINSRWVNLDEYKENNQVNKLLSIVKGRTAGSDAHFAFEVGRAVMSTPNISSQDELKKIILEGTGKASCNEYSEWMDELSQVIKLIKNPNAYQILRILYRVVKRLIKHQHGMITIK